MSEFPTAASIDTPRHYLEGLPFWFDGETYKRQRLEPEAVLEMQLQVVTPNPHSNFESLRDSATGKNRAMWHTETLLFSCSDLAVSFTKSIHASDQQVMNQSK